MIRNEYIFMGFGRHIYIPTDYMLIGLDEYSVYVENTISPTICKLFAQFLCLWKTSRAFQVMNFAHNMATYLDHAWLVKNIYFT